MTISGINLFAVLTAALSAFALGGIWYSPRFLGRLWQREAGLLTSPKRHGAKVFIVGFI